MSDTSFPRYALNRRMSAVTATFFDALSAADRAVLASAMRPIHLPAGRTLFHQGEAGDRFALLTSGRAKIIARAATGRRVLVGLRGAGEIVGEVALLSGTTRSADVIAVDPVQALVGSAEVYRRCILERPGALLVLCRSIAERLRESDVGRVDAAALPGSARLAARLIDLADRYGVPHENGVRIELPITQEELADWTATSRPVVARALAEFRVAGFVTTGRRNLVLTDAPGMRLYIAERC